MAYASTADIKAYLKIESGDTEDDTLIGGFATRAQQIIDSITHTTFEAAGDTTRRFDAVRDVCDRELFFDNHWLAQITSVVNGDGQTISSGQYVGEPRGPGPWYGLTLKMSASAVWTFTDDPEDAIAITGRWAYSVTAPADIVQATIRLAAWLYHQKDAGADVDRVVSTGDGVTVYPMRLPKDIAEYLTPYMPAGR